MLNERVWGFASVFLVLKKKCSEVKSNENKGTLSPDQGGKTTVAEASLALHAQEKQGCAPPGAGSCTPF